MINKFMLLSDKFRQSLRSSPELLISIVCFTVIGIALLPWFRYQLNPDAVSYISIAEKYASGDFRHAINGYWGPALSWALAIVSLFGFQNYIIAAKCLSLLCGIFILIAVDRICADFQIARRTRLTLYLAITPILLNWALTQPITGDLPFAAVFCFLALFGIRFMRHATLPLAVVLGLTSWLLYMTKPVGFYIALANLLLVGGLLWRNSQSSQNFRPRNLIIAGVIFLALCSPWIVALSIKYGHFAVATSTKMNHALVGPEKPINPFVSSIIPPANPTAVSSWEDPSHYIIKDWSVIGSLRNFYFFVGLVISNLYFVFSSLNILTVAGGAILLGLLCYRGISLVRERLASDPQDYILMLIVLGILAYAPILVLERYIYGSLVLCVVLAFVAAAKSRLLANDRKAKVLVALVFIASTWYPAITSAHNAINIGKSYYLEAQATLPYIPPGSAVASNTSNSLFTCYYNRLHCYGVLNPSGRKADDARMYASLRGFGVRYIIDNRSVDRSPYLTSFVTAHGSIVKRVMVVNPGHAPYNIVVYELK